MIYRSFSAEQVVHIHPFRLMYAELVLRLVHGILKRLVPSVGALSGFADVKQVTGFFSGTRGDFESHERGEIPLAL